jgi:hypothetical protein
MEVEMCSDASTNITQEHSDTLLMDETITSDTSCPRKHYTNELSFTRLDVVLELVSLFSFLSDVGSDLIVAYYHFVNGDILYAKLTFGFFIIPSIIVSAISMRWYLKEESPTFAWRVKRIFLVLQLDMVLRHCEVILCGLKMRKDSSSRSREAFCVKDGETKLLLWYEACMESAPELILQIYIIAVKGPQTEQSFTVCVSIIMSLISISSTCVSSEEAILRMSSMIPEEPWVVYSFHIASITCLISSRVLVLSLLTVSHPRFIVSFMIVHWLFSLFWSFYRDSRYWLTWKEDKIRMFVTVTLKILCEGHDPYKLQQTLVYYAFIFLENAMLLCMVCVQPIFDPALEAYVLYVHYLLFFLGITLTVTHSWYCRNIDLEFKQQTTTQKSSIVLYSLRNSFRLKSASDRSKRELPKHDFDTKKDPS